MESHEIEQQTEIYLHIVDTRDIHKFEIDYNSIKHINIYLSL